MKNRPAIDFELLIPTLIGGLSVVGIIVVLMVGRSLNEPAEIVATSSATPFKYVYLGTEPAIATLVVEGSETILPADTEAFPPFDQPTELFPSEVTATRFSPPIILPTLNTTRMATSNVPRTGTSTRAVTATRTNTPSAANTYDDTDSRVTYSGSWIIQNNVEEAYNHTLHISDVADNKSVTIQFSGQEIYFYYQSAPSYGIVTIYLNDYPLALTTVSQAQGGGVWHYILETAQTHRIRIEHTGGGTVNVDRFVIPAATATPTRTPNP